MGLPGLQGGQILLHQEYRTASRARRPRRQDESKSQQRSGRAAPLSTRLVQSPERQATAQRAVERGQAEGQHVGHVGPAGGPFGLGFERRHALA